MAISKYAPFLQPKPAQINLNPKPTQINLAGIYKRKIDGKYRVSFPPNLKSKIPGEIGQDYYLLISLIEEGRTGIKITPQYWREYNAQHKRMREESDKDQAKRDFFEQQIVELDNKGRINLTKTLVELINCSKWDYVLITGRGNYCDIFKLSE